MNAGLPSDAVPSKGAHCVDTPIILLVDDAPNVVKIDDAVPTTSCCHPIYQVYQYCPYGIMCRFGSCSIDMMTGRNILKNHGTVEVGATSSVVHDQSV